MRRGFTLLETLTAMAVLGLLLTLATQILVPCMHFWSDNQSRAGIEEDGMVLQTHLQRDLQQTARQSISFTQAPSPTCIGCMSTMQEGTTNPGFDPGSGQTLWQRYVIYYQTPASQVIRKVWPDYQYSDASLLNLSWSFPTYQPVPLAASQLQQVAQTPNGTEVCVGSNVAGLWLTALGSYEVQVDLLLQSPSDDGLQQSTRVFEVETRQ